MTRLDLSVCDTPIVLLIFNRPRPTARVFAEIAKVRPRKLLVVADGPRPGRSGEDRLCAETRAVIERVDWPCDVQTHYSDINLGCRQRITSGLDWVFSRVDRAIILEDDCLPDPSFFRFCTELLERYRDDERVHMIRGGNFLEGRRPVDTSYYFSRWFHIWGWATWARAWHHNDVSMADWPRLRDSGWLESFLPTPAMCARAREIFDDSYAGRLDTWEYYWVYSSWLRKALAISPATNLVTNIGFGEDATHLRNSRHPHSELPVTPMAFPLRHPEMVCVSKEADLIEWQLLNPSQHRRKLVERLLRRLRVCP
ncbi:MAG TPA: hypothetical protein VNJ47_10145 [Nevskiales bacterium]|nr:hypothetical protein [Nevskiales bacterium]